MISKEVKLPSGAVLKVQPSPFAVSKALYQAIMMEAKLIEMDSISSLHNTVKDLFCVGFSSPLIEACLTKCFERCTINDLRIGDETFEPVERREDYIKVCAAVIGENVAPFAKSLFADFKTAMSKAESFQA